MERDNAGDEHLEILQRLEGLFLAFNNEPPKYTFDDAMEPIIAEEQYKIVLFSTTQSWFFDPGLKNARMSYEQGSRRYAMRWWLDQ